MKYDVFISHASEDKQDVAMPLALHLKSFGISVWLDEFELILGDSLRRTIDRGLAESRFGVVILSPEFFKKEWPQRELDGLVARDDGREKVILPVWHKITKKEVLKYSPTLADRLAVPTERGLDYVAEQILRAIRRSANDENNTTPSDQRAKEIVELRGRMLAANSFWDLEHVSYEVDALLARYPNNPEARHLKNQVARAIELQRRHERPEPQLSAPEPVLPARSSRLFVWLLGLGLIGILLYLLLRWFF